MKINKNEFTVSKHAIDRFIERTPDPYCSKDPEKTILKLFQKSYQIKFSLKYQTLRLLNNDIQEATYYYHSGWIFVCGNNKIITVERQDDKKFGKDLFRIEEGE